MKPKLLTSQKVWATVYLLLMAAMYYLNTDSFTFFGITFMGKVIISAVISFLSVCIFLVQTNLPRAWAVARSAFALMLPNLLILAISIPLWVTSLRRLEEIRGGLFNQLYQINAVLSMAGMVYVLGEKSIWVNLAAMLAANSITLVKALQMSGFGAYLQELKTLILSFANETGPIMIQMEVHELTLALGVYMVFFILNWKKILKKPWMTILALGGVFFFISGFKRIGVFAVGLAIVVGIILWIGLGKKQRNVYWIMGVGVAAAFMVLLYVALVHWGFLAYIEEHWGINLMGRDNLLKRVEGFYHFGPTFMGYGTGFTEELLLDEEGMALHNDIMAMYVDVGFWGLILWGIAMFSLRATMIGKVLGLRNAVLCFCYTVYVIGIALTDNPFVYIYIASAVAVLTIGYGIEDIPDELPQRKALTGW